MDPSANENFTRRKSALVVAVNGLSDPKSDPIAERRSVTVDATCRSPLTKALLWCVIYRHGSGHFRDDNFGNVMEHFYDSTGMTILILS